MSQDTPPPAFIQQDDYAAADSARKRLASKSRFPRFLSLPNLRSPKRTNKLPCQTSSQEFDPAQQVNAGDTHLIHLDASRLANGRESQDKYEWAIVYENQRGMTMFSIPYYSRLSLLPSDPLPFTTPNASPKRSEQPPISLVNYPLPDGDWRWVSKCWMIDMRSDSGEVQHDGFEYNWVFRAHKWRSEVGVLSSGGWVRRRRWVRLMMRPASQMPKREGDPEGYGQVTPTPTSGGSSSDPPTGYRDYRASILACPLLPNTASPGDIPDFQSIWSTEDVELNWIKYRYLMKHVGRDGRKLEIWREWLRTYPSTSRCADGTGRKDNTPMISEYEAENRLRSAFLARPETPPKEYIASLLRIHGSALLRFFVFPDSRVEFLRILGLAGLLSELHLGIGVSEVEFWSYNYELGELNM
ncbi:hypothetical protein BDZ94DRAFT_1178243 [Collybia nuda]|uniref:TECPR1-like DysF domain-containing protein n=1 Tax=Collybia nuda TaxID=64659 RepID=A0A9P5XTC8_9AGAR|nr:hypothetical protein BDZ94DRAFT_1178243 [Collybia nuda]